MNYRMISQKKKTKKFNVYACKIEQSKQLLTLR